MFFELKKKLNLKLNLHLHIYLYHCHLHLHFTCMVMWLRNLSFYASPDRPCWRINIELLLPDNARLNPEGTYTKGECSSIELHLSN